MSQATPEGGEPPRIDRDPTDADPLVLAARLTLLLLVLYSSKFWYLHSPLVVLCIAGLISRRLLMSPGLWFVAASFMASANFFNWYSIDNHKYLMNYWCFALACTFAAPPDRRREVMAFNARLLIGLCMLFATLWKLTSPTYRDGSFFHFTLMADERFQHVAGWFGGMSRPSLAGNRHQIDLLTGGYIRGIDLDAVPLADSDRLRRLARFLTWCTVAIEATLACAFLAPGGRIVVAVRNAALLAFGLTTYLIAPVIGFGWLLMILGLAQCPPRSKYFLYGYLAVFCLIQLYTMPYGRVIEAVRG